MLYELFEEVSITDQLKEEVLAKFLGEPPIYPVVSPPSQTLYYSLRKVEVPIR